MHDGKVEKKAAVEMIYDMFQLRGKNPHIFIFVQKGYCFSKTVTG